MIIFAQNKVRMSDSYHKKESKVIFASSCIETAAKRLKISTTEMYLRMKAIGFVENFIFKCYDALHTQSREHVTEDVVNAFLIWEEKLGTKK